MLLTCIGHVACAATLRQVAITTLRTNPQILRSLANVQTAKYNHIGTIGGYLPKIDFFLSRGQERSKLGEPGARLWRSENTLRVDQLLFNGFRTFNEIRGSYYARKQARNEYWQIRKQILFETAEAYLNILRFKRLIKLAQQNVKIHQDTLRKTRIRFSSGAGQRAEIQLAISRLALAYSQLIAIRGQQRTTDVTFYVVTGHKPPRTLEPPQVPYTALPHNIQQAVIQGLNNSFQLHAAAAFITTQKANVMIAKSKLYPNLNFEFNARKEKNIDGIKQTNRFTSGLFNLSYNLFNGGSDSAAISAAQQQELGSYSAAEQAKRRVVQDIKTAWIDLQTTHQETTKLKVYANASAEVAHDYKIQFTVGKRALFNVLDAEREAFLAKIALTNAQYDHTINVYRVLAAMSQLTPTLLESSSIRQLHPQEPIIGEKIGPTPLGIPTHFKALHTAHQSHRQKKHQVHLPSPQQRVKLSKRQSS